MIPAPSFPLVGRDEDMCRTKHTSEFIVKRLLEPFIFADTLDLSGYGFHELTQQIDLIFIHIIINCSATLEGTRVVDLYSEDESNSLMISKNCLVWS